MSKNESSEEKIDKWERLGNVLVRTSSDQPKYEKMRTKEGWLVASGKERVPEQGIHPHVLSFLSTATKDGCALYAISDGIRVLKNANGEGGVCFISRRHMASGKEAYIFTKDHAAIKEQGLVITTEEGKGTFVSFRTKDDKPIYSILRNNFTNNRGPNGFKVFPWEGYTVKPVKEKKKAEKKEEGKGEKPSEGEVVKIAKKEKESSAPKQEKKGKKKSEQPVAAAG